MKTFFKTVAYLAAAFIIFGSGVAFGAGFSATTGTDTLPPAPVAEAPTQAAQPVIEKATKAKEPKKEKTGIYDEGVLLVPGEVKPGRYRAVVPDDSYGCYWARLKNLDGGIDSIIDNGNGEPKQRMTITVKKTDKAFETSGCGNWVKF